MLRSSKILMPFFVIMNTFLFAELLSVFVYFYENNEIFYYKKDKTNDFVELNKTNSFDYKFGLPGLRLHPLLGYVSWSGVPGYNNSGFFSPVDYPFAADDGDFIVGVFGGSVAFNFFLYNSRSKTLELALKENFPTLKNKNIIVLNFAKEGYKFPQQINTLTHFLLEGQHYDLVINIEGFNEVSGSWSNANRGIGFGMPSTDLLYALSTLTTVDSVSESAINAIRGRRLQSDGQKCWIALCWFLYDKYGSWLVLNALEVQENTREYDPSKNVLFLPSVKKSEYGYVMEEYLDGFIDAWRKSAVMMDSISFSFGISYIQILQPNQYFKTRKVFSKEEADIAILEESDYFKVVPRAYLKMVDYIPLLRQNGLNIVDATKVFDDYTVPVYRDNCCHFNMVGEKIFSDFVAHSVVENLKEKTD